MKVAVIGVGNIGKLHAQIFKANPRCNLLGVCDIRAERARQVADTVGCRAYDSYDTMLAREDLDAVSIATPESARHEPAVAAAGRGLTMLLEKPLGRSLVQVDHLIKELNDAGARVAVNFILHADPRYAFMKEIVANGDIGRIVTCFARRRGTRLGIENYAPWTDLLSSTLIHDIEMALCVNQAPAERVYAEAVIRECASYGSHDAVVGTLRFQDGAVALFETSWVLPLTQPEPLDPAFHLVGDGGSVIVEGASQGMRIQDERRASNPDMTHWPVFSGGLVGGALANSLNAFVECTLDDKPYLADLDSARRAEAVVDAMKRSIESECPVQVDKS